MTTPDDFLVQRDRQVRLRSTSAIVGAVHRVGRVWCAEPLEGDWRLQGRTRQDALHALAEHLDRPAGPAFPAIGAPVTRETRAGGEHRHPVLWEGTVTKHLRTKARVHWTLRNGQRTSAVLDHYPHEIQENSHE